MEYDQCNTPWRVCIPCKKYFISDEGIQSMDYFSFTYHAVETSTTNDDDTGQHCAIVLSAGNVLSLT